MIKMKVGRRPLRIHISDPVGWSVMRHDWWGRSAVWNGPRQVFWATRPTEGGEDE